MNWYLRKADQTIYGPVDLPTLCAWATHARIMPDDELSPDNQTWQAAPSLADLKMEWFIDLGDDQRYGPLHVLALAELVRDGSAPASQAVVHATDGTTGTIAEILLPILMAQPAPEPPPPPKPAPAPNPAPEPAPVVVAAPAPAPTPAPVEKPAPAEKAPEPASQPVAVEEQLNRLLRGTLSRDEANILEGELKKKLPATLPMAGGNVNTGDMLKSYRELSKKFDGLVAQLYAKDEELAQLRTYRSEAEKELEKQVAEAQAAAEGERAELAKVRLQLAEFEKNHQEVVKAFRDLNDRYIRLRQQSESGLAPAPAKATEKPKVRLV